MQSAPITHLKYWLLEISRWLKTRDMGYILTLFIFSRIIFFSSANLLPLFIEKGPFPEQITSSDVLDYFIFWDANWYQEIAKNGYSLAQDGQQSTIAFFPFYPLIVRIANTFINNYNFSQLLISNWCFLVSMMLFYQWVLKESLDKNIARTSLLFLSFSFGTVWFATGYSESLFLLITLGVFTLAKQKYDFWTFILGILTGLTRSTALYSIPAIFILSLSKVKKFSFNTLIECLLMVISPFLGFLGYLVYLQFVVGDWREYFTINKIGWGAEYLFSWDTLLKKVPFYGYELFTEEYFVNFINWSWLSVTVLSVLSIFIFIYKKIPYWISAYVICFLIFFVFTTQHDGLMSSIARYSATVFPIYYALGILSSKYETLKISLLAVFMSISVLITMLIFTGYIIN